MKWNPFQRLFPAKKILGIDIGTSYIKIVELSQSKNKPKLENYGFVAATDFSKKPFWTSEKNCILLSSEDVVRAIKTILKKSEIKTRRAVFSIPDFSTFFTNFELPSMEKKELERAVQYEAKQHIPLSLKEVILDWQVIRGNLLDQKRGGFSKKEKLKILLVAVSNEAVSQYQEVALLSGLELASLEAEVFSLARALIKNDEKGPVALVDIGAKTTTCTIVNQGKLENSYSFDMSSNDFNKVISKKFNIDYLEAEELKKKYGLLGDEKDGEKNLSLLLTPLIDIILMEIQKIFNNFYQKGGQEIQKIILAGGAVLLLGFKEYIQVKLKKEVVISQPFSLLDYPPVLDQTLKEIGPSYAVAVGAALRELA